MTTIKTFILHGIIISYKFYHLFSACFGFLEIVYGILYKYKDRIQRNFTVHCSQYVTYIIYVHEGYHCTQRIWNCPYYSWFLVLTKIYTSTHTDLTKLVFVYATQKCSITIILGLKRIKSNYVGNCMTTGVYWD